LLYNVYCGEFWEDTMKKYIFSVFVVLFSILISLSCPKQISAVSVPMLGTTYTHYSFPNNSFDNGGIIFSYAKSGVRDQVRSQLSQMKNAGVETLDLVMWYMHDDPIVSGNLWGVISSAGGRISDPYRTNLINYLTDVKQAGFSRLLITFGPMWKNGPGNCDGYGQYDPNLFTENWGFIQDIRSIAEQYGPVNIIFDLLGEGAPNDYWPCHQQVYDYDLKLWQLYVDAFGKSDAMISFIAIPNDEADNNGKMLENLIAIYSASGRGFPDWFYFSFYVDLNPDPNIAQISAESAYSSLVHIDEVLSANGLTQSLRTRETWYNNQFMADAIKQFNQNHSRQVEEVIQWFITPDNPNLSINPPYNVDVYKSALGVSKSLSGDITGDNKVDIADYNQLVSDFGKTGSAGWIAADINKDGKVDIFDYNILVRNFGK